VDEATVENGCLRYISGSHKANRLMAHEVKDDPNYTLNRELEKSEYDESQVENLLLPAGGIGREPFAPSATGHDTSSYADEFRL